MTPADLTTVIGLLAASLGFLAATLALLATLNWAIDRARQAGTNAAARHIETCLTQALQMPLYPNLENEYQALIEASHE